LHELEQLSLLARKRVGVYLLGTNMVTPTELHQVS
jgi:hypothetical protein